MNTWTEEHELFCHEHRIPPAAKSLWIWFVTQGKEGTESEPDLQDFNQWVTKKRGKPYGQTYLKKMYDVLVSNNIIKQVKKFTWRIYRVIVKPLDWLKPPKKPTEKIVQNLNSSFKTQPSNPTDAVDEVKQQQLSLNQSILSEEGLDFDIKEKEVLDRPTAQIRVAIALYKIRGGVEKIMNPPGFIRACLRYRYWEQPHSQSQLIAVLGNTTIWDELRGV